MEKIIQQILKMGMNMNKNKDTGVNSIVGLGNDIIEIDRVEKAIDRMGHHFIDKIFTLKEQKYCYSFKNASQRFAGRFAAKEAIAKALGKGIGKDVSWQDMEILNDNSGKPYVNLSDKLKMSFNNPIILISISHCTKYANAIAILT